MVEESREIDVSENVRRQYSTGVVSSGIEGAETRRTVSSA